MFELQLRLASIELGASNQSNVGGACGDIGLLGTVIVSSYRPVLGASGRCSPSQLSDYSPFSTIKPKERSRG
jgi:hypothetical protein